MKESKLVYCRRRPRDGCKVKTYNKEGVCSSCRSYLEDVAIDLAFIKELNIQVETPKD
jgi:hypothetical protein